MKIFAMYLPQFHETSDNDQWWGKGFTEWTAVKRAKSLFPGHQQPKVPFKHNYYNLLDYSTMEWQASLMKQYHIDGLCFYHYWFKDGRRTLEKPAENLLRWKEIDMPFCFCWANNSWTRTWSNLTEKNVWTPIGESSEDKEKNPTGILLEQKYGKEDAWRTHFMYLLPFLHDSRYIKIEGKPIFMVYKPSLISCMPQMAELWNQLAVQNGLKGIYLIGMNAFQDDSTYDAFLYHEPEYTFVNLFHHTDLKKNKPIEKYLPYSEIWERILKREIVGTDRKVYLGGFSGYDDTPRRGTGGIVIGNGTPGSFKEYLRKLLKKSEQIGSDIVFINAWNEWGEGMYLEPDQENGYAYLEAVKEAVETYETAKLPTGQGRMSDEMKTIERFRDYWHVLHQWLLLKEQNIHVADYLYSKGISNVAIYGLGMLGLHLIKELEGGPVQIAYGIDRNAKELQMGFPVHTLEENLKPVDAVIVTVTHEYGVIYNQLRKLYSGTIFSLMDVLENAGSV